jgi:DNA modification methylase
MTAPPDSAHFSNNDAVIAKLAAFYIRDGMRVADITYGRGVFWKKTDTSRFDFRPTDLIPNLDINPTVRKADFRRLPYSDSSLHVVVFDPPYLVNPPTRHTTYDYERKYRNFQTTQGMKLSDILNLYQQGMREAKRVLVRDGMLWVKCKDAIESSRQRWSHLEIKEIAEQLGFYAKELFVVVPKSRTYYQRQAKHHACRIHSYLWIFKPN